MNDNTEALAGLLLEDLPVRSRWFSRSQAGRLAEDLDAAGVLAPSTLAAVELFIEDDGKIMNAGSFDALIASDFGSRHITLADLVAKLISTHPVGDLP